MEISEKSLIQTKGGSCSMNLSKLRTFEAIAVCCIIVLNKIILNPTKNIIYETGSSSVLNIIYVCLLAILLSVGIWKVFSKFPNSDVLDIAEFSFGKTFKWFFAVAFLIYFLFVCSISVRSFVENIKIFYQKELDLRFLLIIFLLAAAIANRKGVGLVGRVASFITPLTIFGIFLTFISVAGLFNWYRIFPILGYGINETFFAGASNLYAFSSLSILLFLPPLLEKKADFKKVTMITTIITSLMLIFSITCMVLALSFSFTSSALSPMYLVIRSIEWGSFFESPEAIFTFIFILSMISFLSVLMMVSLYIISKIGKLKNGTTLSLSLAEIVLGASLIAKDIPSLNFLESVIYKYFSLIFVFGITSLVLLVGYFKKKGANHPDETME